MRITYVITIQEDLPGIGGHFWSLRTLVECMMNHGHDCHIVTISSKAESPITKSLNCSRNLVLLTPNRPLRFTMSLRRAVFTFNPDVIHCFDLSSFFHMSNAMIPQGYPTVLTKCGGPLYKRFHPVPRDLILFSAEDMQWFRARPEYSSTRLHHIPNRISPVHCDPTKCKEVRQLAGGRKTIIRICRIGSAYEQSIRSGAELVGQLRSVGLDVVLVIVGVIESEEILGLLMRDLEDSTLFITESKYYHDGAAILDAGDMVFGTGRGLMEGASLGKPLLAPASNSRLPVLVTQANIDSLFQRNFSPRAVVMPFDRDRNVSDIIQCLTDESARKKACVDSQAWYQQYFAVDSAYERYMALYRDASPPGYRLRNHIHCIAAMAYTHLQYRIHKPSSRSCNI